MEATKKLLEQYKPEFIVFGKSMVLCKEPVAEIRKFVDDQGISTTIMYDMAHVLGLVGDYFQKPFEEGAEIVTGSTHKTFFGPQRGVIGVSYKPEDLKWSLWETMQTRTFPGSVSNHHLGTLLAELVSAYEMNAFKDQYQKAVTENAKWFAQCVKEEGMDVAGDSAMGYTETHQVIVKVGYSKGPEVAERLERNNIIVNYQATPEEEGFTDIAATMRLVAGIEKSHEERYRKLLQNIEEDIVFQAGEETVWVCRNCGYIHIGKSAPAVCPACKHPQAYFERRAVNY